MPLVLFSKKDSTLAVSINRGGVLNAVNSDVLRELRSGLDRFGADSGIRALMLHGQGGCFCAGADIRELSTLDHKGIRRFHGLREKTFALLENFQAPTFAVIEKYALGTGLELALCCDFRIAQKNARLGVPSARLGLVESYEYLTRLVRAVGISQAKKMVFSGERISAETAFSIGLIEEIVANDRLYYRADELAQAMARHSAHAIERSKAVIDECDRDPYLSAVADTAQPMLTSLDTDECRDRLAAFLNKSRR